SRAACVRFPPTPSSVCRMYCCSSSRSVSPVGSPGLAGSTLRFPAPSPSGRTSTSIVSCSLRTTACSIQFSSCRTLPGHSAPTTTPQQPPPRPRAPRPPCGVPPPNLPHKMPRHPPNPPPPRPQRRPLDHHHRYPIVQILPKRPLPHRPPQILVRRRDQPY